MSRENVELVRSLQPSGIDLVGLFPEGEAPLQAALSAGPDPAAFDSDLEVRWISGVPGLQGREYHGVDGLVEGWRDWLAAWASYRIEADEFIDAGDEVVVLLRVWARTARDDVAVEHSPAVVWGIRDRTVVRLRFYLDRGEAFEAVGLSE